MNIVLTLLVRDEADIIASTLDYHLQNGVDLILVTDNGSTDGTREILASYEASGNVCVFDQEPSDFSQGAWVTQLAQRASIEHHADWVINGDSDEFFIPTGGSSGKSLKETLMQVPPKADLLLIERHDFVPMDRPKAHAPPVEMIYRKAISTNIRGTALPPKMIHRGVPDVVIAQGNHSAVSPQLNPVALAFDHLEIFHYPIRSLEQFTSKVRNGGSGYTQNQHLPSGMGFHKRYWYQLLEEGNLQEEFEKHFCNTSQIEAGLHSGELVIDRTLSDQIRSA